MQDLLDCIEKTFPLSGRHQGSLPARVAQLSRLLTSGRSERERVYLSDPAFLSAYLRYFLPWNVYRLSRLALPLSLKEGDQINDLGAGPLTLALALYVSRPDLRQVALEFRCLDRSPAAMEAGKKLFFALSAGEPCPWKFRLIKGEIRRGGGLSAEIRGDPAAFSAAINVYNELFWDLSPVDKGGLRSFAQHQGRLLSKLTAPTGAILVVEPGIPRSGEFISILRGALIQEGRLPLSPCTHGGSCPMPGGREGRRSSAKWCHFPFDTQDAPRALHALSRAAQIPKERAVLSYLLAGPKAGPAAGHAASTGRVRIISDSFLLEGGFFGRYACGDRGLVLLKGSREELEEAAPGQERELSFTGEIDPKSGAPVGKLAGNTAGNIK
ncbi:MAG: rRNA methyltransferase [Treponema sp.]|nr:rRNA methyltransferase [Treponema sp.]